MRFLQDAIYFILLSVAIVLALAYGVPSLLVGCLALPLAFSAQLKTKRDWILIAILNLGCALFVGALTSGMFWYDDLRPIDQMYAWEDFRMGTFLSLCSSTIALTPIYLHRFRKWGLIETAVSVGAFTLALAILLPTLARAREKPVIYLYPESAMEINVQLDYQGELTHTYPAYRPDGWTVHAQPDGTLTNLETGREHYCLFWEGEDDFIFPIGEGFVVVGDETIPFLEKTLAQLGLNEKEANEFIIYWQPRLESNPYNLIHFATDAYAERVPLILNPKPDTVIRVLMIYRPLRRPLEIPAQSFPQVTRKGFTVVEWGGTKQPARFWPGT